MKKIQIHWTIGNRQKDESKIAKKNITAFQTGYIYIPIQMRFTVENDRYFSRNYSIKFR